MTKYKAKNDFKLTKFAFYQRLNYRINALGGSTHTNLKNIDFSDLNLYGKVNRGFQSIVVNDEFLQTLDSGKTAINFVVEAFSDVKKHFRNALSLGQISPNEKFLSDIRCYSAYQDPTELYSRHIDEIMLTYNESHLGSNRIKTLDDYIEHLPQFIKKVGQEFPLTYSSWIRSKRCPIFISGLVINVSNNDLGDDSLKESDFINSLNFDFYVNTCKAHGFYVAENNPSIIIADINSAQLKKYMAPLAHADNDEVLSLAYRIAHFDDIYFLRSKIIEHYDQLIQSKPIIVTPHISRNNKLYSKAFTIDKSYNINNNILYKLYLNIKNIEEGYPFGQSEIDHFIERAKKIEKVFDSNRALGYISKQFSTIYPAKYGGLNYYKDRFRLLED